MDRLRRIVAAHPWATALLAGSVFYGVGFLFSVLTDPLVRAPQLDGAEMVHLARAIHAGTLPAEPFYRSMGYPALLALFGGAETTAAAFGQRGAFAGVFAHLLNALLVGLLAARMWRNRRAGWIGGGVYAVYPVALFFAVQLLDITWALTAFLASLYALARFLEKPITRWALATGLALGLAVVLRPHFLFVAPVVLLLAMTMPNRPWKNRSAGASLALAAFLAPLAIQALASWQVGGQWRWLPWQGSYNLFAANSAEANGRYFKQSLVITDRADFDNPTRAESEARYALETGAEPPFPIEAMKRHWHARFLDELTADPIGWLGLLARKAYYTVNDFEQYNNLTYGFHKARWPFLRCNPLGWGMLAMAAGGVLILVRPSRSWVAGGLAIALAYAGSLVLFYASARFRLPLAPLLCIGIGGVAWLPRTIRDGVPRARWFVAALGVAVIGAIAYSGLWGAHDRSTHVQDALLVGNAATTTGDDALALEMATGALAMAPKRNEARRLALVSYWNLRLTDDPAWRTFGDWPEAFSTWIEGQQFTDPDPALAAALGTVLWNTGRTEPARRVWRDTAQRHPDQSTVLDRLLAATETPGAEVDPALRRLLVLDEAR